MLSLVCHGSSFFPSLVSPPHDGSASPIALPAEGDAAETTADQISLLCVEGEFRDSRGRTVDPAAVRT